MNTVKTHHGYCTRFVAVSTVRTSPKSQEEHNIGGLQLHTRPCHTDFYNRAIVLVVFYSSHRPARPQSLSRVLQYGHLPQQMGCSMKSASNMVCCLQYAYSSLGGRRRKMTRLALFARDLVVHESSSGGRHPGHLDSDIPAVGERRQHFFGFMKKEDKIWPYLMKRENYRRAA